MNKKKILICHSNEIGEKVYKLLKNKYKCKIYTSNKSFKNKKNKFVKNKKIFLSSLNKEKKFDFIILIFWPFIVDKKYFNKFSNSINFHPSYLPYHRGWYPHIHAKIKNEKWGVSLHQIDEGIDTGDVWVQKKINIDLLSDNKKIYDIAKNELFNLFKKNLINIIEKNKIKKKQLIKTKFLKKKDLLVYDKLSLNTKYSLRNFINLFLARQWGNKSYLKFKNKDKYYKFHLKINNID